MNHRTLAASFIVTVSAVVACSSAPPPPPENARNPPEPPPTATIATAEPEVPDDGEAPDDDEGPQDDELRDAPTNRHGTIERRGDKCFWTSAVADCEPNTRCNPPAPTSFEVKCAEDELPEAPAGMTVRTRDDGTCFYVVPRPPRHCPPRMSCNPPAPDVRNVRCSTDD